MGYQTEFTGHVDVTPPLNQHEVAYLRHFANTRRMARTLGPYFVEGGGYHGQDHEPDIEDYNRPPQGQPNVWCKWEPTDDGTRIEWNGMEKFYAAEEWMRYLVDHFLRPDAVAQRLGDGGETFGYFEHFTFDHVVNGVIEAEGEDPGDTWKLIVKDNEVSGIHAEVIWRKECS